MADDVLQVPDPNGRWLELKAAPEKKSNTRCSSIISAHAVADRKTNGGSEAYLECEECRRINEEIRRREHLGIGNNAMFPRRISKFPFRIPESVWV
jgi:hypothetical protein